MSNCKMSLLLLCALTLAGCGEKTTEELKAEVARREAAEQLMIAQKAAKNVEQVHFMTSEGWPRSIAKVCIGGVLYYHRELRHAGDSGMMAPVFDPTTKQVVVCQPNN